MEENKNEALEQLKRNLRSYGSYTRRIKIIESDLYKVTSRLKDSYEAAGVGYGEKLSNSDPQHPYINQLIYEEADLVIDLNRLHNERDNLCIDDKLKLLNDRQYEVINELYFNGTTFRNATIILNRSKRSIEHNNDTALAIMLKS